VVLFKLHKSLANFRPFGLLRWSYRTLAFGIGSINMVR